MTQPANPDAAHTTTSTTPASPLPVPPSEAPTPAKSGRWRRIAIWAFRLFSLAIIVSIVSLVKLDDTVEPVVGETLIGQVVAEPFDASAPTTAAGQPAYHIVVGKTATGEPIREALAVEAVRRRDVVVLGSGAQISGTITDPWLPLTSAEEAGTWLARLKAAPTVTIHPKDAEPVRVASAEIVEVYRGRPAVAFGLWTLIGRLDFWALPVVVAAMIFVLVMVSLRWWLLARRVGVDLTVWDSIRLMGIGMFYTYAPGGLATGDVIKAMYLRRKTNNFTQALVSVFADRLIGLQTMVGMGLIMLLIFGWELADRRPAVQYVMIVFAVASVAIGLLLSAFVLGLFSSRTRRVLRVRQLLDRLPFKRAVEALALAVKPYRYAKTTVFVAAICSLGSQIAQALVAAMFGAMLGIDVPLWQYFVLIPVTAVIGFIPALPGGIGLTEGAYVAFFAVTLSPTELSRAFALSILMRLSMMLKAFLGIYWAFTFGREIQPTAPASDADSAPVQAAESPSPA